MWPFVVWSTGTFYWMSADKTGIQVWLTLGLASVFNQRAHSVLILHSDVTQPFWHNFTVLQHSTDDRRKFFKKIKPGPRVSWERWHRTTTVAVNSVKVLAWSTFNAKYLPWHSWQKHACNLLSLLLHRQLSTDCIPPSYCFSLQLTVKMAE